MTVAERERQMQAEYRHALPEIVTGLRDGVDPVSLGESVQSSHDVSATDAFRWIQLTEQAIDRYRRRRALVALIPVWLGGGTVVLAGLLLLLGATPSGESGIAAVLLSGAVGALLFLVASVRARGLSRRVYREWLENEL